MASAAIKKIYMVGMGTLFSNYILFLYQSSFSKLGFFFWGGGAGIFFGGRGIFLTYELLVGSQSYLI